MNESLCAARSRIAHAMESLASTYLSEARRDAPGGRAVRDALKLLSQALHDLALQDRIARVPRLSGRSAAVAAGVSAIRRAASPGPDSFFPSTRSVVLEIGAESSTEARVASN